MKDYLIFIFGSTVLSVINARSVSRELVELTKNLNDQFDFKDTNDADFFNLVGIKPVYEEDATNLLFYNNIQSQNARTLKFTNNIVADAAEDLYSKENLNKKNNPLEETKPRENQTKGLKLKPKTKTGKKKETNFINYSNEVNKINEDLNKIGTFYDQELDSENNEEKILNNEFLDASDANFEKNLKEDGKQFYKSNGYNDINGLEEEENNAKIRIKEEDKEAEETEQEEEETSESEVEDDTNVASNSQNSGFVDSDDFSEDEDSYENTYEYYDAEYDEDDDDFYEDSEEHEEGTSYDDDDVIEEDYLNYDGSENNEYDYSNKESKENTGDDDDDGFEVHEDQDYDYNDYQDIRANSEDNEYA